MNSDDLNQLHLDVLADLEKEDYQEEGVIDSELTEESNVASSDVMSSLQKTMDELRTVKRIRKIRNVTALVITPVLLIGLVSLLSMNGNNDQKDPSIPDIVKKDDGIDKQVPEEEQNQSSQTKPANEELETEQFIADYKKMLAAKSKAKKEQVEGVQEIKYLSDDELLAKFPPGAVVLVEAKDVRELVFVKQKHEEKNESQAESL